MALSPLLTSSGQAGIPPRSCSRGLAWEQDAHIQSPHAFPREVLQTRLILHEVPVNATAFTVSRSSARADDDEGVYNNIFYLYHTFQTEHEISAPFTAVPGGNNPPSCSRVGLQRCRELMLGKGTATAAPARRPPPLLRPLTQLRRRG